MSLIHIKNLTFSYEESHENIFEDTTFQLDTNWKVGFIGRNGRGKTTFLHLLLNTYEYKGKISTNIRFQYFPFEVENPSQNTIDILEKLLPTREYWEFCKELSKLEVAEDALWRPFMSLSGGEKVKVLLATLFLKTDTFLLIDEPTNHLDLEGRKIVSNYLKTKKGFILVSHDRGLIDNCVDHILSINKTTIDVEAGNFSSWRENKRKKDEFEIAEDKQMRKDIKRLEKAAEQTNNWAKKVEKTKNATRNSGLKPDRGYIGHKAAKMMKRSKTIEKRKNATLDTAKHLLHNIEKVADLKLFPLTYQRNQLLSLKDVSIFYGNKSICESLNFAIKNGDRIALKGKNGSGKSTILKLLSGQHISYTGDFQIGNQVKASYVSQDTSFMTGSLTAFLKEHALDESLFKSILRKLDFSREQFDKKLQYYSSGQKKKVLIAKSLCERAHLYIWDEPLNFIDIFSRMQIEQLLIEYKPTIIFVEHDETFIENIATQVISL